MRFASLHKTLTGRAAIVAAFCVLLVPAMRAAPLPDLMEEEYLTRTWQSEDGLPQNSVLSLAQTADGYLWVGTLDGAARFNGAKFENFSPKTSKEFKAPNVMTMAAGEKGTLWIGLEGGGLVRRQEGKFTHYVLGSGPYTEKVRAIIQNRDGSLWLGTALGLIGFKDGVTTNFMFETGFANNSIKSMLQDSEGNLWIATGGGLVRWKDGKFQRFTRQDGLSDNNLRSVFQDRDETLWIGGAEGLTRYKDGQFKVYTTKDGLSDNNIRSIYRDRAGHLWIGTLNGLNQQAGERFETVKGAVIHAGIFSIFEDQEGDLWVGTNDGLSRVKLNRFKSFTNENGLPYQGITSVLEDRDRNLWIGSAGGGLTKLAGGKFTTYTTRDGLSSDSILGLYQDPAGTLWIGTDGLGVNQLRDGKIITYTGSLPSPTVRAIGEDKAGRLWVGTYSGLQPFNERAVSVVGATNRGEHFNIRTICPVQNGDVWIGTQDGLDRLQGTNITTFTITNGLGNNFITALYEDQEGVLWIGHDGGGLDRWKNGKFANIRIKNGLFSDTVFCILEDATHDLWMSCRQGIFRAAKKQLNDFADGRIQSVVCQSFDRSDGMVRTECSGVAQPSGWRDHTGRLWFATSKGVVMTAPDKIKRNQVEPPVHIEEVFFDGKPVELTAETQLPAGRTKLEFHYAAMSFMTVAQVRYKYKLEGYDTDWVDAGRQRTASYGNLRPGDYTFRVVACNNDGVWNETGEARSFSCVAPFYQSGWFYALIALLAAVAIASAIRARERKLKQREEELMKHALELQQKISERQEAQNQTAAFSALGQKLNAATSVQEAAEIIVKEADELFGWDCCVFMLYSEEKNESINVMHVDTIDGQRVTLPLDNRDLKPTPMLLRVIKEGPQLILRAPAAPSGPGDLVPFGNMRPSVSLMYVPVRDGKKTVGMFTIQSYTAQAYHEADLKALEALASHCGGAMERITSQQGLREARDQLELRVARRTAELSRANEQLTQQIAERQQAEGALLKSELRLRLTWESSLDGMRVLDEAGVFVLVNPAYCQLVGKPAEQLIGQSLATVYAEGWREKILQKHREQFGARNFPTVAEKEAVLWNGEKIHVEVSNCFLEVAGEPALLLTTLRDITDRKFLEDQVRQSQKMESVGQLAAGVAHDFNTLLTVILGHSAMLLLETSPETETAKSLKEISDAAERAANLTRQLLTFSRKQVMVSQAVDLNQVITHVTKMLHRILGAHIDLQLDCATALPALHADPGMMEQIIINLSVNARDAMPNGGRLTIATSLVDIDIARDGLARPTEARSGRFVCLRISDSGTGMDAATLKRIFEPFFTTKEVGKGTGLGLSTVFGIVKQHQGWIEVESELSQGTVFKVFFPA